MTTQDSYLFESKDKKKGGALARFCKFLFFVIAFFLVIITILANMGGSNDMLRESVERFISDAFGKRPAQIGILYKMGFFPSVGVHAANIKVLSKPEENGGYPVVEIGQIEAFMGFWSVATSEPTFKKFMVDDVTAIKGMFVPEEFSIQHIFVDHEPGNKTATLTGNGKVGKHDWSFTAILDVHSGFAGKSYSFAETVPVTLDIADVNIKADFSKSGKEYFKLDNMTMTKDSHSVKISLAVYAVSRGLLKVKGSIIDDSNGSEVTSELLLNKNMYPSQISGDITLRNFEVGHASNAQSDLAVIISRLRDVTGYAPAKTLFDYMDIFEIKKNLDTTLKFENAKIGDQELNFEMPYIQKNGQRKLGPLRLDGGTKIDFPPVVFVDISDDKKAFMVMGGDINTEFSANIFSNVESKDWAQSKFSVECGVGVYGAVNDVISLDRMNVHLNGGEISASEQKLEDGKGYNDIEFTFSETQNDIAPLELPEEAYNFIKTQLNAAYPNPTKCDDLIKPLSNTKE